MPFLISESVCWPCRLLASAPCNEHTSNSEVVYVDFDAEGAASGSHNAVVFA